MSAPRARRSKNSREQNKKVFAGLFQKAAQVEGRAAPRRAPQSAKSLCFARSARGELQKQSGGLFLQEGTPCKRGRPLFAARRLDRSVAARKRALGKPRRGFPSFAEPCSANKRGTLPRGRPLIKMLSEKFFGRVTPPKTAFCRKWGMASTFHRQGFLSRRRPPLGRPSRE